MLEIFVYGSLKQGYQYHHLCEGVWEIKPAWVWGRMHPTQYGYPMIEIPPASILMQGSTSYHEDVLAQNRYTASSRTPSGDWDRVEGELMSFTNPQRLSSLDHLEDFQPSDLTSMYMRVLTTLYLGEEVRNAWIYVAGPNYIDQIRSAGRLTNWPHS